ncbi:GNAT family N-acetyltransferase [Aeromonas media]|uniref:GNAT family N-acetyltransferase n=1 Tax=Aeromonas media TaxID=651 RepID=UPI002282C756|nr:GNAT family N-acetyltransferase [Aeromonas media]MCY9820578.1 GNAT family N-acetyltransferase [Aeromonas media]
MSSTSPPEIRLDPVTEADLPHIYRGLSDPRVIAYYGVSYDSLTACQAQMDWYAELTRTGRGAWHLVRDRHTGEPFGAIGYNDSDPTHRRAELGYWLYPEHWGKGVMSAALRLWISLTYRTTALHRLLAVVEEPNTSSARLLERAGFHYEGTARECEWKEDRPVSLRHYALLRSDLPDL